MFLYKVLWKARKVDAMIILDTVSVALPAVLAGWLLHKTTIIRTGGDFVWEQYVERTGEKVKLSEFYTAPRKLSVKERLLVWLQRNVVLRLVTHVVYSSAWQRDMWQKPYGVALEKTAVIENAHTTISPNTPNVDAKKKSHTFVWVGRDIALKNVDVLKTAFRTVQEKHPDMELKLLTDIPHEEVVDELTKARCFVLPSLSEVTPNLVYEALAAGTPVICTADTGILEHAPGGVMFVDTNDEQVLTNALLSMCDDEQYERFVGEIAQEKRTYKEVAGDFLSVLPLFIQHHE
jgi:glycosyltransferase involved in cell wall biosynthesis